MEMELECDIDLEKLRGILENAPIEDEYIEYKGIKYIKEQYCISKSKIKEIRDKAEVMDYYTLNDVIDDLNKLLGDED